MNGSFDDAAVAATPDDEQQHDDACWDEGDNNNAVHPQQQQLHHCESGGEVSTTMQAVEHVPVSTLNPYDEVPNTRNGEDTAEEAAVPPPAPPAPYDESADGDDANDDDNGAEVEEEDDDAILSPLDSVLRQNANSTVRWTMTAAAVLFAAAGVLTVAVAAQFRFFLVCVWVVLLFLFAMFVWFVQQTVICSNNRNRNNKRVFHPAVHAVAEWVQQQVQDFRHDVRDYYDHELGLLSDEAAFDHYKEIPEFHISGGGSAPPPLAAEKKRAKSRSALFRGVVKPVLNVAFRGRRKKRRQRREQQEAEAAAAAAASASGAAAAASYVPPNSSSGYNHPNETELV